ncbi:hypothetical protein JKG47_22535 [Acidithiobacillus sp. MC6.1]|nr:hypothetical protein [Acidithiobacillus sp. MC6.1]
MKTRGRPRIHDDKQAAQAAASAAYRTRKRARRQASTVSSPIILEKAVKARQGPEKPPVGTTVIG